MSPFHFTEQMVGGRCEDLWMKQELVLLRQHTSWRFPTFPNINYARDRHSLLMCNYHLENELDE